MNTDALIALTVSTWRRHDHILRLLLDHVPDEGFSARPAGSRGRDVARQFDHLERVRSGWLIFQETGKRPKQPRQDESPVPTRAELQAALTDSGEGVASFLERALRGEATVRYFGQNPVRWMGYLIAHESHHRGQILLALKQNGLRMHEDVAMQGMWGTWIFGKED